MHVALYHDAVIPPRKYGGTERVIYWLIQGLRELGHRATLIARPGSHAPGAEVIPIQERPWEALIPSDVDVVHLWSTPRTPPAAKPFVVTIEGNGQPDETFHPNTIFISRRHAENHGAAHFVYNGLDPEAYTCQQDRGGYLVFLAKASWKVKNLEGAVAVARAAGLPLEVLGSRDWPAGLHRLLPRIRGVRYHGMVDDARKREILSRARALLFPVRWHEPFGIAVTEALASGCPVLGTPYGSLPEIVTPAVGLLTARGREIVDVLRDGEDTKRFTPERCRRRVFEGFTHLDMARAYLRHYQAVLETGKLSDAKESPKAGVEASGRGLLDWTSP